MPSLTRHQIAVWMRWTARIWSTLLVLVFVALAIREGAPESPEGAAGIESLVQYVLVAIIGLGTLLAWRWPVTGGSIITLASAGLGVLATLAFHPANSFLIFLAFLVPGVLFLISHRDRIGGREWLAIGSGVAVVLVAGGIGARSIYDYYYGPTHPESTLKAARVDLVEWIWAGGVTEDAVALNAKLARDTQTARFAISEREDMGGAVFSAYLDADERSNSRVVSGGFAGLQEDTRYYYAIEVDGRLDLSRQGRFHTFGSGAQSFSVAFGACARLDSNGSVFDRIRGLIPDLYLITGDFFYGDINVNDPAKYREEFDRTLTAPAQAALYRSAPIAYTWDDHDYGANNATGASPGRAAARSTYRQYVPHYALPAGQDAGAIYQAFTVGRARFILLDLRSERTPDAAPDDEAKSMLGAEQKAWLKQELLDAKDRFPLIVLVSSVPWIGEAEAGGDSWAGYTTERRELADFIAGNQIRGPLMLGGDAHMIAIDDGTHSDYATNGGAAFPVMHAGALDRPGSMKGGPYSEGAYPGGGQFGLLQVDDSGGATITVALTGYDWSGKEIVNHRYTLPALSVAAGVAP